MSHVLPIILFCILSDILADGLIQGELTEKNNERSFFIKILKSKLRVLLLAGAPSPDVSAIRQALTEDDHFTIQAFVQKNSNFHFINCFL